MARKDSLTQLMLLTFQEFPILRQTCLGSNPYIRMVSLFHVRINTKMIFTVHNVRFMVLFFTSLPRNFKSSSHSLKMHISVFQSWACSDLYGDCAQCGWERRKYSQVVVCFCHIVAPKYMCLVFWVDSDEGSSWCGVQNLSETVHELPVDARQRNALQEDRGVSDLRKDEEHVPDVFVRSGIR